MNIRILNNHLFLRVLNVILAGLKLIQSLMYISLIDIIYESGMGRLVISHNTKLQTFFGLIVLGLITLITFKLHSFIRGKIYNIEANKTLNSLDILSLTVPQNFSLFARPFFVDFKLKVKNQNNSKGSVLSPSFFMKGKKIL